MKWSDIPAPVWAAFIAFAGAQIVLIVQTIMQARTARKQREHDTAERDKQREHDTTARDRQRQLEHRRESWRAHREAIAAFLRALERTKYDLGVWGARHHAFAEKYESASEDERDVWRKEVGALYDRVADAMMEMTYWSALLPTPLRKGARDARDTIDATRNTHLVVTDMRADAREEEQGGDAKLAMEIKRDALKSMRQAQAAFVKSRDAFADTATKWLDEHHSPEAHPEP